MASYRLTKAADEDLVSILNYTEAAWGSAQAVKYLKQIEKQFKTLVRNPRKGRKRDEIIKGVRSYPEGKHVIFYREYKRGIHVLRVLHERMDALQQLKKE